MSNKFEKLLDYLVNEEMDKANELFHEIVVEKSRTIYENLISEESEDDESMDEAREEDEEDEEDESMDESMMDDESVYEIGGDSTDDFEDDVVDHDAPGTFDMDKDDDMGDHDMGMGDHDMGMEGDEDAPVTKGDLEDFKAEILSALGDHPGAEVDMGDDDGFDDSEEDDNDFDFDSEDEDEEDDEEENDEEDEGDGMNLDESFLREYNKVVRKGKDYTAGSPGEEGSVHKKSSIATGGPGINTKANAKNIAQNNMEGDEDGTKPHGKTSGLVGNVKGKFTDSVDQNVDGKETKGYKHPAKVHRKGESSVNKRDVLPNR